ncbi:MAG: folate-binding protein YgfZ [Hyphomicrobiaceae bacterium]
MSNITVVSVSEHLLARAARRGIDGGMAVALDYGDVNAEWVALDTGAAIVDRSARRLIEVTGDERADFLHGQVTADVRGLVAGVGAAAAVLSAQGKALGLFSVFAEGERLLLASDTASSSNLREALERFLVADDCEFEDLDPGDGLGLIGPCAGELLAGLGVVISAGWSIGRATLADTPLLVFSRGDLRVPSFELIPEDPDADLVPVFTVLEAAGAVLVGRDAEEVLRIESGTARYGVDIDEGRLVVEARLEWAIHFNKGCYVGQEVVERAVSRGRLNRELVLLNLASDQSAPWQLLAGSSSCGVKPGDSIAGGNEKNVVTSVAVSPRLGPVALAYVGKDSTGQGAEVAIDTAAGQVSATVLAWPRQRRLAGRDG